MSCGARVHPGVRARRAPLTRRGAGFLLAMLTLPGLVACEDGCGEESTPSVVDPTILIQTSSRRVEADGVTFAEVTVRAYDSSSAPDNSVVTVSVDRGFLTSDDHTVTNDGSQLTGTPANGVLKFRFTCDSLDVGTVTMTAANAEATVSSTLECIEPSGTVTLGVLLHPEQPCTDLLADGESYCIVPVRLVLDSPNLPPNEDPPQAGVGLTASVVSATLTNPVQGQDPNITDLALLSPDQGIAQQPQSQVNLTTDQEGYASVRVHSRLNEPMVIQLRFTGTAPGGQAIEQTVSLVSAPFTSAARVYFVRDQVSVGSDQEVDLTLRAVNHRGATPADDTTVLLRVAATSGAVLRDEDGNESVDGELEVGLTGGSAVVTFVSPIVSAQTPITVTASYRPHEALPVTTGTVEVKVYPEDSLLLNASADTNEIRANDNTVVTITADVEEYSQNTVSPAAGATVRFSVNPLSLDKIILGTRAANEEPAIGDPAFPASVSVLTDAQGRATITVSSRTNRVSGNAAVQVEVLDGNQVVDSQTIAISVVREPLLQSIVFVGAEPPSIGVRGGPYPSSTVVTFQLFDDLANPLPNVDVLFQLPATADPSATVVANGTTDASGRVSTTLSAGTIAAPLKVIARAHYGTRQLTTESESIPVTSGLPSFANSYLICDRSQQAQRPPAEIECTAALVDRFTNRAPAGLAVQFRAEGGSINAAVVTGDEGAAQATYVTGGLGLAPASLLSAGGDSWSYGAIVPFTAAQTARDNTTRWDDAAAQACFDADSRTACSVFDLCFEAEHGGGALEANSLYCPLPIVNGEGCWNHIEAGVLTGDATHLSDGLLSSLGITRAEAQDILDNDLQNPLNYFGNPSNPTVQRVRGLVDAYRQSFARCGAPAACLTGVYGGLPYITGDECYVAPGCMDFSPLTHCPQDGLATIVASTRGEESFTDVNGNGVLDFQDLDGDGRHSPGEPLLERSNPNDPPPPFSSIVIDLPEVFLDKNDNCFADDYTGSPRLHTQDAIRLTDLYNDEDGSGGFGYGGAQGSVALTNGHWDRDKEIMLTDHLLLIIGSPQLEGGVTCPLGQVGTNQTCPWTGQQHLCAPGGDTGVLLGCFPQPSTTEYLAEHDVLTVKYRWTDANGNCFSPGFSHYGYAHDMTDYSELENPPAPVFFPTKMDDAYCGFGSVTIPGREWCEAFPVLGSPNYASYTFVGICHEGETPGYKTRTALLQLTDGPTPSADGATAVASRPVSVLVNCPP